MSFHGTKGLFGIKVFILDRIDIADRELCMDQDEWAYRLGWTVTKKGFGSRFYREPRFDQLKAEQGAAPAEEVGGNVPA
ncbi:hypothetical protein [Streptosporangium sp. NPDC000396]|uniref:hypothetical protein n=1 Tax=Streptosporangium sp. NPDC000396 TaxID=3366185 RepID=UPI0036C4E6E4